MFGQTTNSDSSLENADARQRPAPLPWCVWMLAAASLALHLLAAHRYGYFRDELYYLACSRRLAWGYVDHPPMVAWLMWLIVRTLGDSLLALRAGPALIMAIVVVLCAHLARALSGGRFAQSLAALVACVTPAFLALGSVFTMNALEVLWWTLVMTVLVGLLRRAATGRWLLLGLLMGLGALTKLNIAFLALALLVGVLLTPQRRWLAQPGAWLAVAVAAAVAAPLVAWQQAHGWPTLEFLRNIRADKNYPVNPIEFAAMQFAVVHPMIFPIWVAGVIWLLRARASRLYRLFGWTYVALFVTYCALQAKFYYLFPAYPIIFAAGSVAFERFTESTLRRGWRAAIVALLLITTIPMVPLTVPVLPIDLFLRYNAVLDIQRHLRFERGRDRTMPIIYSDMFGWRELAQQVTLVRDQLPEGERAGAVIVAANYGEAAAIDFFGGAAGLPPARSGHNAYHTWGPGEAPWDTVIAIGFSQEELDRCFFEVVPAARRDHPYARERQIPIHVCRGLKRTRDEAWNSLRRFR